MIPTDSLPDTVRRYAEEAAEGTPLFVVDVTVRGQQGSRVIEVYADADSGATPDDLAALSRALGARLEAEDLIKGRYHLNVSSPGADRPLTLPRQFPKHVGRSLRVVVGEGEAQRTVDGTLTAADDDALTLDVDGGQEKIPFADVADARVRLPW